jgi:hypothetical protein
MKHQNEYYTLIASLPPLPHFDRAERLPINRVRLRERFKMLEPDDMMVVQHVSAFYVWHGAPSARTDGEMVAEYNRLMKVVDQPLIREMMTFPADVRTIMVALRRRHLGQPPVPGKPWAVGQWVRHIERNWYDADFRLSAVYPWVPLARQHLEAGETLVLERLLMDLNWEHVNRLAQGREFGFDAFVAYLFKWYLLERWLFYDSQASKTRFEELLTEVTNGDEPPST